MHFTAQQPFYRTLQSNLYAYAHQTKSIFPPTKSKYIKTGRHSSYNY